MLREKKKKNLTMREEIATASGVTGRGGFQPLYWDLGVVSPDTSELEILIIGRSAG